MSSTSYRKVRDFHSARDSRTKAKRRFSAAERAAFDAHGWRCHYCGSEHSLVSDHIVAKANGGTSESSNLIPACWTCNASKGRKSYEEFLEWIEAEVAAFEVSYQPGAE